MRTVTVTERIPAPGTGRLGPVLLGLLLLADAGLLVAAFAPSPVLVFLCAVVAAVLEAGLALRAPFEGWLLRRIHAGAPYRGVLQGLGLLVSYVRSEAPTAWMVAAVLGLLGAQLLRVLGSALAEVSTRQRRMPILTRGLDLAPLTVPSAPPGLLRRHATDVLSWPTFVLIVGGAAAALVDSVVPLAIGIGIAVVVPLTGVVVLARAVLVMRPVTRERFVAAATAALERARPSVALYHAGGPDTLYQAEMWIEPLERLDLPVLVVLRDREALAALGPTRLPVLCVEPSTVLMGLDLPGLELVLYPAHAVGNLHMLRRRGVRHAFIGHGDSDKPVTVNPFLRAYSEIWVSGPASRQRLEEAGIDVRPEQIREVGRPQVDAWDRAAPAADDRRRLTVLYAPTWEGYEDEPDQTSVGPFGIDLIRRLIADPYVRVLYRPHPLTGVRDPAVGRAHREIVRLLGDPAPLGADRRDEHRALAAARGTRDELDLAMAADSGRDLASLTRPRTELVAARAEWARRRLADDGTHRVVPSSEVDLASCFEAADVLLADVSSVISDFLATGKPYGVTNPGRRTRAEVEVRYPSSRGGYLVESDGRGLDALLEAGRGGRDPAAEERARLRELLLGPDDPPALVRFRQAVLGGRPVVTPQPTPPGRQASGSVHPGNGPN